MMGPALLVTVLVAFRRPLLLQRRTSTTLCLMLGNEVRDHYWLLLIYREGLEPLGRSEVKAEY